MSITLALGLRFDSNSRQCLQILATGHAANITGFASDESIIDVSPIAAAGENRWLGSDHEILPAYDLHGRLERVQPAISTLDIYV